MSRASEKSLFASRFPTWITGFLFFFSISKSKLPGYILPAIPAVALLLAQAYIQLTARESRFFRWTQFGVGALAVVAFVVLLPMNVRWGRSFLWIILGFGIANMMLMIRGRKLFLGTKLSAFCVIPILLLLWRAPDFVADLFPSDPSGKTLSREIQAKEIPLDQIHVMQMNRAQQYSLNFYLHHEIRQWDPAEPKEGYLVLQGKNCTEQVKPPFACTNSRMAPNPSGWFIHEVKRQEAVAAGTVN